MSATGVAGTTTLGNEAVEGTCTVALTGVVGTATLGEEAIEFKFDVTGVSATTSLGIVNAGEEIFGLEGISSTGSIGNVVVWTETRPINVTIQGTETTRFAHFAAGRVAQANFYTGEIIPDTQTYTEVTTGVSQSYTEVTTGDNQSHTTTTTGASQSYTETDTNVSQTWTQKTAA